MIDCPACVIQELGFLISSINFYDFPLCCLEAAISSWLKFYPREMSVAWILDLLCYPILFCWHNFNVIIIGGGKNGCRVAVKKNENEKTKKFWGVSEELRRWLYYKKKKTTPKDALTHAAGRENSLG